MPSPWRGERTESPLPPTKLFLGLSRLQLEHWTQYQGLCLLPPHLPLGIPQDGFAADRLSCEH